VARAGRGRDKIWRPFDEADASRRTIYAFVKRSMIVPLLEVLDLCDTTKSSAERINTAVPTQALTLFNGEFVNRQARHLAERLIREAGPDPSDRIDGAYRLAFARPPTADEQKSLLAFLREETERSASESSAATGADPRRTRQEGEKQALVQLCRVIFNMNEFAYTDSPGFLTSGRQEWKQMPAVRDVGARLIAPACRHTASWSM